MKCLTISLLAILVASSAVAQQQAESRRVGAGATTFSDTPNLFPENLGKGDLVGISVYDAPELSHTVRVDPEGNVRLPMMQRHIRAEGLMPAQLENAITSALVEEHLMVSPVVSVSVVEYHSRPITVVGAVKTETTFQANGSVTLLEAITRAGGLSENAGADILVSRTSPNAGSTSVILTERIPVHALFDTSNPASNMKLEGGETIRVTNGGQLYIVGNVKHPGAFPLASDTESSVLKAMALSGGMESFSSHTAYIYRMDDSSGHKNEIPIPINKIMARKAPDVPLYGNDVLYVPGRTSQRTSARVFEIAAGVGLGVASLLIYMTR